MISIMGPFLRWCIHDCIHIHNVCIVAKYFGIFLWQRPTPHKFMQHTPVFPVKAIVWTTSNIWILLEEIKPLGSNPRNSPFRTAVLKPPEHGRVTRMCLCFNCVTSGYLGNTKVGNCCVIILCYSKSVDGDRYEVDKDMACHHYIRKRTENTFGPSRVWNNISILGILCWVRLDLRLYKEYLTENMPWQVFKSLNQKV